MRPFTLGQSGHILGGPIPLLCAPIVASSRATALLQAEQMRRHEPPPDIVELRADQLDAAVAIGDLLNELAAILSPAIPLLFTQRRHDEGGAAMLAEPARLARIALAIQSGCVALVDIELATVATERQALQALATAHGVGCIVSAHDFTTTPADGVLDTLLQQLAHSGGDGAKLAVTANGPDDALRLLQATQRASSATPVPLTTMAMGAAGTITRLAGPWFGSALSFASVAATSAPGQLPLALIAAYWRAVGLRP